MSHGDFTRPSSEGWVGFPTDLGDGWLAWEGETVTRLGLPGTTPPATAPTPTPQRFRPLVASLQRYFAGRGPLPTVASLGQIPAGTGFEATVLHIVASIPAGGTSTYAEVAAAAGRPAAVRAVGAALARNRFAPVIPCHRVVGSAGSLRGYAGGIDMKRRLIDMEARGA